MQELTGRLAAVDPEAGTALRVIAYFDSLIANHAGLESLVRGAAVLAGCPAGLIDPDRRVHIRVESDGHRRDLTTPPDSGWPILDLVVGDPAYAWLERVGPHRTIDTVVLERLAAGARVVLDRTRGRVLRDDAALVEALLDAALPADTRSRAARRLGLDAAGTFRALAVLPRRAITGAATFGRVQAVVCGADDAIPPDWAQSRIGAGPVVTVLDLPASWAAAQVALRFTSSGTGDERGPTMIRADDLGGLSLLAVAVDSGAPLPADVHALEKAASTTSWLLETLEILAAHTSLRSAAGPLHVHHSTLQDRLLHAEKMLGWNVSDAGGRLRLQLALALRRLYRSDF